MKRKVTFRIDDDTYSMLTLLAICNGVSIEETFNRLVTESCEKRQKEIIEKIKSVMY